jgi:hypothetical protein
MQALSTRFNFNAFWHFWICAPNVLVELAGMSTSLLARRTSMFVPKAGGPVTHEQEAFFREPASDEGVAYEPVPMSPGRKAHFQAILETAGIWDRHKQAVCRSDAGDLVTDYYHQRGDFPVGQGYRNLLYSGQDPYPWIADSLCSDEDLWKSQTMCVSLPEGGSGTTFPLSCTRLVDKEFPASRSRRLTIYYDWDQHNLGMFYFLVQ